MNDLFLRECRGESTPRRPVWMMRQAGRFLPEYRAIRARVEFLELCKTPELAAEVTVQPVDILGVDAAIVFADILLVLEAMGMELRFEKGDGPSFPRPISSAADVADLQRPDVDSSLGYVFETVRQVRSALSGRVPVIGFAGTPWTLSAYAVQGRGANGFPRLLAWSYSDPASLALLLDKIADLTVDYLTAQIEAGAQAVQLFDTWGGLLDAQRWRQLAMPPLVKILEGLPGNVPRIFYLRNSSHLLEAIAELPVDVVSVDWRTPLDEARRRLGPGKVLQGNLDPAALLGTPENIRKLTLEMLERGRGGGHVANLGHGILPMTPVENARVFIETVQAQTARPAAP